VIVLTDLRVEHCREPLGLWTPRPRFSWKLSTSDHLVTQQAYEIEVLRDQDGSLAWSSGTVASSESVLVPYEGPALESATRYLWRVRADAVCADKGREQTSWAEGSFETSLMRRSDWLARFVEPEQEPVTPDGPRRVGGEWLPPEHEGPPEERLHPPKYLRQAFELPARPLRARLYATSHGVYRAEVNGIPVGDQVLAPGYESYDKRLSFQTYDVTRLLTAGRNVLGLILGDGWYAGRIDFTGTSAQYGDRLRAGWQLLVHYADCEPDVLTSDATVVSSTDGPVRYSDIFIGERHDARFDLTGWSSPGFDASSWKPVKTVPAPEVLVPFADEPVRRVAELAASEILRTPAGETVVDFGQVIAGRVRLRVQGPRGTVVKLEHSEVLNRDGNFFNNIGGFNKDQTDYYVLSGAPGGEVWEPLFTFHGFRYIRVTGYPGKLAADAFRAVVIASDLEPAGDFACSDARITRLHRNVVWSQRGNFLAIPTDCPQRERVGWTGDLQIFAPAATRNMKVISFLRRWLENVRLDQAPDGLVPVIVPVSPFMHGLSAQLSDDPMLSRRAVAGWGDAAVVVPWVLYERYGDRLVLEENYVAMKAWVDRQVRVAESELPARLRGRTLTDREEERQRLLWNSEPNFGDWNAPSVRAEDPSLEHLLEFADRTGEIIGAMFHGYSAELLHRTAAVLGHDGDARRYGERARHVREAIAEEYLDGHGHLAVESQGLYVLALAFSQVPAWQREAAVARLTGLIRAAGNHLDTGFLSVPFLLDVLSANGQADLARTLLWQETAPSWLYAIDRGATTIWEDWTAIAPDGHVGASSFNHYAFGCVDEWLYGHLAGIRPASPGFRASRIQPDLDAGLDWVEASQDTPYGPLKVRWVRDADDPARITIDIEVPPNTTAALVLPDRAHSVESRRGGQRVPAKLDSFGSGAVTVTLRLSKSNDDN
jgi:alpha-L-rhamnosidase